MRPETLTTVTWIPFQTQQKFQIQTLILSLTLMMRAWSDNTKIGAVFLVEGTEEISPQE